MQLVLPGVDGPRVTLRLAAADDVVSIVGLLAEDPLGAARDGIAQHSDLTAYQAAFTTLDRDPSHLLLVATHAGDVIAIFQLSFIPGMARRGALRAHIEAVRVREDYRNSGLGQELFAWAIDEARRRGCALVQLTSDKSRTSAHRFYDGLGFVATHEGFKLEL